MSSVILESNRCFRVWFYSVSHRVLLLRSVAGEGAGTRVDVLFKAVSFICLPVELEGVLLRRAAQGWVPEVLGQPARHPGAGDIYLLSTEASRAWVQAGTVAWHEDEGPDSAPSYFSLPRLAWD